MNFKKLKNFIFYSADCFLSLIGSKYSVKTKFKLFFVWLKINFKFVFLSEKTSETFLGFKIKFFDYKAFKFIFEEIFIRAEYYFKPAKDSLVIFDCGANIGMALLFFKWLCPNCKIYAFEPDKKTFDVLQENIRINCLKGIYAFNYALYDNAGKLKFFVDKKVSGSFMMSVNQIENSAQDEVQAITLSEFLTQENITNIDLLKMDIEGSELKVFSELDKSEKLKLICSGIIEYHHNFEHENAQFAKFLEILEKNKFNYQINSHFSFFSQKKEFQNIMVYLNKV